MCMRTKPGRIARGSLGAWTSGCWMGISLSRHAYERPCSFFLLGTSCSYNPDAQGRYASQFPSGGQGFIQPRGDIRESIMPRGFRVLSADIREAVDAYFHRKELEDEADRDADGDQEMSTDTEAATMVRRLKVGDPIASASLRGALCDTLALATALRLQEQDEYYYDSDDSVLNLDEEYPGLAVCIVEWQAARRGATPMPAA